MSNADLALQLVSDFIADEFESGRAYLDHEKTALTKLYTGFEYAVKVINGERVAGQLTIKACQRFLDDFARADSGTLRFNFDEAMSVLKFYVTCICHVKGKLAGKIIDLMDWHVFILINIFGWQMPQYVMDEESGEFVYTDTGEKIFVLNDDGDICWVRRFKTAYIEVARKNAKSTLTSGIGLYMGAFDGEGGAEVYSAATTRDQARIVFGDAKEMVKKSKYLSQVYGCHKMNIHHLASGSKFEPLSADANTLDGLNIHCGLVDELHAHKTRDVWDVLETATGAREQPLILGITTAGFILDGICYEIRDYCKKILEKSISAEDGDRFFGVIYTLDDDDDPFDEKVWFKANPGLGICKKWEDLRALATKAKEQVSARPNFFTKHLNKWVRGSTVWMDMDRWGKCEVSDSRQSDLSWVGLDIGQKIDITSAIKIRQTSDGHLHIYSKFWIPEERLITCSRQQAELYEKWRDTGHLTITDGAVIDIDVIRDEIKEWCAGDNLQAIGFDPWSATQFSLSMLEEGYPMVEVPQSTKNLSEAMKQCEAAIYGSTFHHDDNPVMTWMMANVVVKPDKNDNIYPLKETNENKIDGPVAMFTGMSRVILGEVENKGGLEWYDDEEDIIFF